MDVKVGHNDIFIFTVAGKLKIILRLSSGWSYPPTETVLRRHYPQFIRESHTRADIQVGIPYYITTLLSPWAKVKGPAGLHWLHFGISYSIPREPSFFAINKKNNVR
jgi:hypothetical protein